MAPAHSARASVLGLMKAQPSAMDTALIRPVPTALFRSWQTTSQRLPR